MSAADRDDEGHDVEGSDLEGPDVEALDVHQVGPEADATDVVLREERLDVSRQTRETGAVRVRKQVEHVPYEETVLRGTEHADVERLPVLDGDSGEVETLPDGSLSVPVLEEQVVVTKRLVVRERIVIRKHTVYDEHVVSAQLRREHVDIETEGDVAVHHGG